MWLINTTTLQLESFPECPANTYAILSHTWGTDAQELTFDEFKAGTGRQKEGFRKVQKCCEQAHEDGLNYAWVDTCCIDKRSSTELSEAINSMFTWYAHAKTCYVYLADVSHYGSSLPNDDPGSLIQSRWFKRGWTLQELIAPQVLLFYTCDWIYMGDKQDLAEDLRAATGIEVDVLIKKKDFRDCSIAQRMSWASKRETARDEDIAYCLIGLFNVNISLRYGEGSKAFLRLQESIILETDDETIFAWTCVDKEGSGLLAPSPAHFSDSAGIEQGKRYQERPPYRKTNLGIQIECEMLPFEMNTYTVPLHCERRQANSESQQIGILLCRTLKDNQYRRVPFQGRCIENLEKLHFSKAITSTIFVPSDNHTVELLPHEGLPVLRIVSKLHTWQFPKALIDPMVFEGSSKYWATIAASEPDLIHTEDKWESILNQLSPSAPLRRDLESGITQHVRTEYYDADDIQWVPKKILKDIQFESRHLDAGILIAFTRSDSWVARFYYLLEIGFDMDFKPVCILHTKLFRLRCSGPLQRLLPLFSHRLPTIGSFWKTNKSPHWSPCVKPTWQYAFPWVLKFHQNDEYMWTATGNRHDGLHLSVHDMLPREYGLVDVRLTLRPIKGLEWQLVLEEEPLHSEASWYDIVYQRRSIIRARCWLGFLISESMLWGVLGLLLCAPVLGGGFLLCRILNITFGAGVSLAVFIIISPWSVRLCVWIRNALQE